MKQQTSQNKDTAGTAFRLLLSEVDNAFAVLKQRYAEEVRCRPGCDDCCHAVFTVSLVEAFFIERHLRAQRLTGASALLERISGRGEDFERERQRLEKELPLTGNNRASVEQFAQWRIRCPMLEDDKKCAIYPWRPLTCRAYGLPLSISGRGHVCGLSGFAKGRDYPTIKMENIHRYLLDLSTSLAAEIGFSDERVPERIFLYEIIARIGAEP